MKDNIWRMIAVGLLASAVTGFTSWLTFGLTRVSKAEMESYVTERITVSELNINISNQPTIRKIDLLGAKVDTILEKIAALEKKLDEKK